MFYLQRQPQVYAGFDPVVTIQYQHHYRRTQQQQLKQHQDCLISRQLQTIRAHTDHQQSLCARNTRIQPRNPGDERRVKMSSKPLTSFSITDILEGRVGGSTKHSVPLATRIQDKPIVRPWDESSGSECSKDSDEDEEIDVDDAKPTTERSPLDALLQMASGTHFDSERQLGYTSDESGSPSDRRLSLSRSSRSCKKRRKTRTAFTNQQIFHLEKHFIYRKYLTPADRDEIAMSLRLTNAQVITWFQNRRAKLKRDLEELKADVMAAKALGNEPSASVLGRLEELIKANDQGLKKKDGGFIGQALIHKDGIDEQLASLETYNNDLAAYEKHILASNMSVS